MAQAFDYTKKGLKLILTAWAISNYSLMIYLPFSKRNETVYYL